MNYLNQPLRVIFNNASIPINLFNSTVSSITLTLLPIVVLALGVVLVAFALRKLIAIRVRLKTKNIYLEIRPPAGSEQSSFSTEQLFTILHGIARGQSLKEKLLGIRKTFSLEILSTRNEGIKYLICLSADDVQFVKRDLLSYLPQILIKETKDYLNEKLSPDLNLKLVEFKLAYDNSFPLRKQASLDEHDPISYLLGNMTKLIDGELIAFQIVASPFPDSSRSFEEKSTINLALEVLFKLLLNLLLSPLGLLVFFFSNGKSGPFLIPLSKSTAVPEKSGSEKEKDLLVKEKLTQPLFKTTIRLILISHNNNEIQTRLNGFIASLETFARAPQRLTVKNTFGFDFLTRLAYFQTKNRLLCVRANPLLSITEIAGLYHFPFTKVFKTEGLVVSKNSVLPAPLSIKKTTTNLDVIVGRNIYGGEETLVGLTPEQREQHAYIIGRTGTGKTTIIKSMAYQDICSGKGLCVIDPHGDMVAELLERIPEERKRDVIYLNPADKDFPVGLNILSPGIHFTDVEEEHEWITGTVMSIFMKLTPKDHWGQRMEHILRNAVLTALVTPSRTEDTPYISLLTIQKLLTDAKYRKKVASTLSDPVLKQFWEKEYSLYGRMQQAQVISPITNKLGEFITGHLSRNILLQEKTTINIGDAMNKGKILLVNLSKGNLGEERSAFFGILISSLIQLATYARSQIPESSRRDFFLYIDEFQNFATESFAQMFSEARKYRLFIIPSHQNVAQLDDLKTAKVISSNAGTIITLKSGPDDENFLRPYLEPEVEKGQILNLTPHHFFMKVTTGESEDAFSGETIPLEFKGDKETAQEIIENTRKNYAAPQSDIETQLGKLFVEPKIQPQRVQYTKHKVKQGKAMEGTNGHVRLGM